MWTLIKSQKNDVFRCIGEANLLPRDFEWQTTTGQQEFYDYGPADDGPYPLLRHVPTDAYFVFGGPDYDFIWACYPSAEGTIANYYESDWGSLLNEVKKWLAVVAKESEPDLWTIAYTISKMNSKLKKREIGDFLL
jgi:hypothetical protein